MVQRALPPPDPDRQRGAFLGLAVGDAVGTTLEFRPPGTFEPIDDMVGGGPFDLPPGAWTDDTSMAACLAESLVECGGFDADDQMRTYLAWYRTGHWSSTGVCFDIGRATARALERFERAVRGVPKDALLDGAASPVAPLWGDDLHPEVADTTAAIAGQLAGALYGASGIPAAWMERLVQREALERLADGLVALGNARR